MSRRHIPGRVWSRRKFLSRTGKLLAVWPVLGPTSSAFALQQKKFPEYPFSLGVASGDPAPESVVLWTRLAPRPLEGGGMPRENIRVVWEVAEDEAMTQVVAEGTVIATPELAHSVHVDVPGLRPDRWYFYRFHAGGESSPIGRTRTTPRRNVLPQSMKFGFVSCQHYEAGYYTAYDHLRNEDPDLIAHLGDYIYEGPGKEGRVRRHTGPLLRELDDYRNRYALYKSDEMLQAAHAACPWIVTWDDHEVANNYAAHVPALANEPPGFLTRRANAYQAYYEHLPVRTALQPRGPDMRLYHRTTFGRLVNFAVLDTRQYRSRPEQTILGDTQERWLYRTLEESDSVWNSLAQQVLMAPLDRQVGEEVRRSSDQWPAYEAGRQRLMQFFSRHPDMNPIVLTGDSHKNWVNDLLAEPEDVSAKVVATEFAGTSISSGGDGQLTLPNAEGLMAENPFLKYLNAERGYVLCDVTPDRWTSHYRTVPYVTRPGAPVMTRQSFVVETGKPGAEFA